MNELLWDTELETIALCWVNTCGGNEYEYGVCLDTEYAKSGYNVGFKRISVLSNELKSVEALKEHINGWFSEADSFSKELIDDYSNDIPQSKFRRFSQLAWAETIYIGCARSIYGQYITMFACVYSPSGNIDGEAVFTKGPPCSGCKYGKKTISIVFFHFFHRKMFWSKLKPLQNVLFLGLDLSEKFCLCIGGHM